MSGLGLRQLRKRNRRPELYELRGDEVTAEDAPLRAALAVAVDRYRLRQEHEADVVAFVLAGLDVGSLGELHRLVEAGRASEVSP